VPFAATLADQRDRVQASGVRRRAIMPTGGDRGVPRPLTHALPTQPRQTVSSTASIGFWESREAADASADRARHARERTAAALNLTVEDVHLFDMALNAATHARA
jgi:hypothetical protein